MIRIAIVALLVVASHALGQTITAVSGNVASGSSITISGYGFGVKSPAAPILWDDFEGRTADTELDDDDNWTIYGGSGATGSGVFSSVQPYSGLLSAHNRCTGPFATDPTPQWPEGTNEFNTSNFFFSPTDTIYYSYFSRYVVTGDSYVILKNGRSNAAPNRYNGAGNIYFSNGGSSFDAGDGDVSNAEWHGGLNSSTWTRHEMYKINSTAGTGDGEAWWAIGGQEVRHETGAVTMASGEDFSQTNIILGLMFANPRNDGDHRVWVDDVYVDNTRARVEIGNASSWSACTNGDIQIPSEWSDTEITVAVNQGQFEENDEVWLYVVTASGTRSSGYSLTIGAAASEVNHPDIQSATRSGTNAVLTWLSGDGGPYTAWLQADDVRGIVTTDTTVTIPMSTAATDVTVKDGTSVRKASIAEAE